MVNIYIKLFSLFIAFIIFGCNQEFKNEDRKKDLSFDIAVTSKTTILENTHKSQTAVIYRSTDLGKTWSPFDQGIPNTSTLSAIKQYGNKIYVTTDYHGIFLSSNGEDNWRHLYSDKLKNLDINCIEVEKNRIAIGTLNHGVLISNDAGINWNKAKINIEDTSIRAFIKMEGILYAGTDSGIYQSMDMGNTWSHVFGKIQILGFTSLNNKIYAATQQGALVRNGKTSNWESIYEGDALHDIGTDGIYIYVMTIGQQLLKTKNDGKLWENAQNGITRPPNYYTNELKHIGKDIFSAQWIGIYHSSNNGNNWSKLSGLPDSTAFSTLEITDFGIIAGISIR